MKAAICYEFGKPLVIEDVECDPPGAGEVKVRVAATGICHSDVHVVRGEWGGSVPVVAGHESAGIIEEVGGGVSDVKSGDRVVVSLLRSCGTCPSCAVGASYRCGGSFPLDKTNRIRTRQGQPLQLGLRTGSFAEYVVVHRSQVVKIPESVPFACAALLGCAVITGAGAVLNTAKAREGSRVVVIGAGGVGLNAVQGAVLAGARQIIALDIHESKCSAARGFGATHGVLIGDADATTAEVRNLTDGRGADYVFITVGNTKAMELGFGLLASGGKMVIVGLPSEGSTVTFPAWNFVSERTVVGSPMGSTRFSVDVPWLADLYLQGRFKLDELVTAQYPLEKINEGIEAMERGEALRNVIVF